MKRLLWRSTSQQAPRVGAATFFNNIKQSSVWALVQVEF
ncbi:hypothetical protein PULV_a2219 [Pseudoalteromonas ulvae UL12]|nr:hypothetical protein [Pseudoalteromonas ulvae UL12]MBE0365429.1 hypothetical protein [Pseudoalteromonas ulvae UL12]